MSITISLAPEGGSNCNRDGRDPRKAGRYVINASEGFRPFSLDFFSGMLQPWPQRQAQRTCPDWALSLDPVGASDRLHLPKFHLG